MVPHTDFFLAVISATVLAGGRDSNGIAPADAP